jgi:hypothetical protein
MVDHALDEQARSQGPRFSPAGVGHLDDEGVYNNVFTTTAIWRSGNVPTHQAASQCSQPSRLMKVSSAQGYHI